MSKLKISGWKDFPFHVHWSDVSILLLHLEIIWKTPRHPLIDSTYLTKLFKVKEAIFETFAAHEFGWMRFQRNSLSDTPTKTRH
jgi:hypothetical protein